MSEIPSATLALCTYTAFDITGWVNFISVFYCIVVIHYRTPTLARVITESVEKNDQPASASKKTAVTTVLCKLACIYNMNLNAYQKQVGLTLRSSRLTKTSINRFSRLYDSVSYKTMTKMLRQYSKDTNELMKEWEKEEVIHCGDNLDIRSTVRFEGDSKSYHDLHMYNNMVYKSPIPTTNLSDDIPTVDVGDIDYSQFLLTVDEEDRLMKAMSFSVLNSWRNNVEMCTNINVTPPPNKYGDLMVLKTQKVAFIVGWIWLSNHYVLFHISHGNACHIPEYCHLTHIVITASPIDWSLLVRRHESVMKTVKEIGLLVSVK